MDSEKLSNSSRRTKDNSFLRPLTSKGSEFGVYSIGYSYQHQHQQTNRNGKSIEIKNNSPSLSSPRAYADVNLLDLPMKFSLAASSSSSPRQRPLTGRERVHQSAAVKLPNSSSRPITAPARTNTSYSAWNDRSINSLSSSILELIDEENPSTDISAIIRLNGDTILQTSRRGKGKSLKNGLFNQFVQSLQKPLPIQTESTSITIYPELVRKLHAAVKIDNRSQLLHLLSFLPSSSHSTYLSARDATGSTLLMQACKRGYTEMVRLLLSKGVDVNLINTQRETAVTISLQKRFQHITQLLVMFGCNLTASGFNQWFCKLKPDERLTPHPLAHLFPPMKNKSSHHLSVLIRSLSTTSDTLQEHITSCSKSLSSSHLGLTMLHWAAVHGKIELLQVLLRSGIERHTFLPPSTLASAVEIKDRQRFEEFEVHNALSIAYLFHHNDAVKLLQAAGIGRPKQTVNILTFKVDIASHAEMLYTHLQNHNISPMISYLEEEILPSDTAAVLNYQFPHNGQSVLYGILYLPEKEAAEIATLLVGKGAAVEPSDFDGITPLQLAFQQHKFELAEKLLQMGATSLKISDLINALGKFSVYLPNETNDTDPFFFLSEDRFVDTGAADIQVQSPIHPAVLLKIMLNRNEGRLFDEVIDECVASLQKADQINEELEISIIQLLLEQARNKSDAKFHIVMEKFNIGKLRLPLRSALMRIEGGTKQIERLDEHDGSKESGSQITPPDSPAIFSDSTHDWESDQVKLEVEEKTDPINPSLWRVPAALLKPMKKLEKESRISGWVEDLESPSKPKDHSFQYRMMAKEFQLIYSLPQSKQAQKTRKSNTLVYTQSDLVSSLPASNKQSFGSFFSPASAIPHQKQKPGGIFSETETKTKTKTSTEETQTSTKPRYRISSAIPTSLYPNRQYHHNLKSSEPTLSTDAETEAGTNTSTNISSSSASLPFSLYSHLLFTLDDLATYSNRLRGQGILSLSEVASFNPHLIPLVKSVETGEKHCLLLEEYMESWEELARTDGLARIENFLATFDRAKRLKEMKTDKSFFKGPKLKEMSHLGWKRREERKSL